MQRRSAATGPLRHITCARLAGAGALGGALLLGLAHVGSGGVFSGASSAADVGPPVPNGAAWVDTIHPGELEGDPDSDDPVTRGAYLARAGNCIACHTVEDPEEEDYLAGGYAIESPFGTFYGTNITPHPDEGIGEWDVDDLAGALREGHGPDGTRYYPVFPFTAFTGMTDEDVADLHAFLQAAPARDRENEPHDVPWYMGRATLGAWTSLHLDATRFQEDPQQSESWNRGAYLTEAVAHCVECHTPRTLTGGLDEDLRFAGTEEGGDGDETMPNITPDAETGIGDWSERELVRYLEIGMDPDGDFAGGSMSRVISEGTGHLTEADLEAMAEYILSLEPIEHEVN